MALLRSSLSKRRLAHPPSRKLELLTTNAENFLLLVLVGIVSMMA